MNQIAARGYLWLSVADYHLNPGAKRMQSKYHPKLTEPLWQKKWEQAGIQQTRSDSIQTKCYVQERFPYPTDEIHMGHVRKHVIGDMLTRYYRMQGFEVAHSVHWNWADLQTTDSDHQCDNINQAEAQLKRLGLMLDWDRTQANPQPDDRPGNQCYLFIDCPGKQNRPHINPVNRMINLGNVRCEVHFCQEHGYLSAKHVQQSESSQARCSLCQRVLKICSEKMCAAKRNRVSPQEMFQHVGADSARLFCLFAAPPHKDLDWSEQGVLGCYNFLRRVWTLYYQHRDFFPAFDKLTETIDEAMLDKKMVSFHRQIHRTIFRMTQDLQTDCQTNTAIAALMELLNSANIFDDFGLHGEPAPQNESLKLLGFTLGTLARLLYPFVPHLAEELWSKMGYQEMICLAGWPPYRARLTHEDKFTLAVQVNGKLRSTIRISRNANQQLLQQAALDDPKVQHWLKDKSLQRVIAVPGRVVNLVVG